jgi:hypothetical protein
VAIRRALEARYAETTLTGSPPPAASATRGSTPRERSPAAAGAYDGRAVALLASRSARPEPPPLEVDARLAEIGSPPPSDISDYDELRDTEAGR